MDFGTILQGAVGLGLALAGGKAGKALGKSSLTGDKPWQKLLAPAGATAIATIYQGVTGDNQTAVDIAVGGAQIGVIATGTFSLFKNIKELGKLF